MIDGLKPSDFYFALQEAITVGLPGGGCGGTLQYGHAQSLSLQMLSRIKVDCSSEEDPD